MRGGRGEEEGILWDWWILLEDSGRFLESKKFQILSSF